jgi:hypothetical protein
VLPEGFHLGTQSFLPLWDSALKYAEFSAFHTSSISLLTNPTSQISEATTNQPKNGEKCVSEENPELSGGTVYQLTTNIW